MKIIERLLLLLVTFSLFITVQAQTYSPQQVQLADRIESVAGNSPPEIAYIQTSKDIYETGEDLWFKIYLLDAQSLVPSLRSKTLYLQLLNENDKGPIWQEKYEILNGCSNGKIYLSTELKEGNYLLAAYTPNSFFNDTIEFKAIRRIKILNDIASQKLEIGIPDSSTLNSISKKEGSIQFNTFPEGGYLVSGIQSRLAFKAVKRNGDPVDVKGELFEDNVPLLEFSTTHMGMGSFNFTPDKNKKYFIRLSRPAIDTTYLLSEILPEGMTMRLVDRNKDSLSFKIAQNYGLIQSDFYIRVQCRGVVYGMTTGKLNRELMIKIPLSLLPQGIAEVTLFNNRLVPIAERLVYINQDKKLNITAKLSGKTFSQRGKAELKISVKDDNGNPVMANLGVTVFDKLYQNPLDSNNILSHVYLFSQLKGIINNPSFYFNSKNQSRAEALDLLMLTQGWRKYLWSEDNLNKFNKEPQQIIFDGIMGAVNNPGKKRQSFVIAYSPDIDSSNVLIPANPEGVFTVSPDKLKIWEKNYVYLKPFGPNGSNLKIKLDDPFETINRIMNFNEISYPIARLSETKKVKQDTSYSIGSDVVRIKEVTIKGQKENAIRGKYMGTLDSLARLDLTQIGQTEDHWVCRYNIWDCCIHPAYDRGSTKPIEGKKYRDCNGSIHVAHYNLPYQELTEEGILKKFNISRVKAYYGKREFYKPNYDKETGDVRIPDFRNTLLWEPSIFTDTNGEASVNFFCSDINSDFVGRIEGVGGNGLLGSEYFSFTVRKTKLLRKK
jgi:hypothetical protein